ncbi:hypothetical protein GGI43DRAFT_92228 [Trichoderma evansii]
MNFASFLQLKCFSCLWNLECVAITIQDELLYLSPDGSLQASQMIHRPCRRFPFFSYGLVPSQFFRWKILRIVSTDLEFLEGPLPHPGAAFLCLVALLALSPSDVRFVQRPSFAEGGKRRRHRGGSRGTLLALFGRRPDMRRNWQLKILLQQ